MTPALTILGADLSATGGDFDGDGLGDLAVIGREVSSTARQVAPKTYVIKGVSGYSRGTTLALDDADVVVTSTGIDQSIPSLRFDASGQDLAFLPGSTLNGLTSFTTSLWFRTTSSGNQTLIDGASLPEGSGFEDHEFTITLVNSNELEVKYNQPSSFPATIPTFNDGNFHHLVVTRDLPSGRAEIYFDGALVQSFILALGSSRQPLNVADNYLVLGNDVNSAAYGLNSNGRFEGDLTNVSIWGRALSLSEVRAVRDGQMIGNEIGLRAWYKLDEANGLTLTDASGRSPDGRLGKVNDVPSLPTRLAQFDPRPGLPPQPYIDLNADGLSDLVVSAAFGETSVANAGRINVIFGTRAKQTLPTQFDVLENWSVAGSGSFVKERVSGQPVHFDLGGKPFTFSAGSGERWFQFTTVGDGKAENSILVNGAARMDLLNAKGEVLQENQAAISLRTTPAGTYYLRVFEVNPTVISLGSLFDDSAFAPLDLALTTDVFKSTASADDLAVDKVQLGGPSTFSLDSANQLNFNFTNTGWGNDSNGEPTNDAITAFIGDNAIRTTRDSGLISTTGAVEDGIGIHANGLVTFDLNELRASAGYDASQPFRFLVDKAGLNDFGVGTIRNMVIISSESAVLQGFVNGLARTLTKTGNTWSFGGAMPAAQTNASGFRSYDINIPTEARYLTLAVSSAGNGHSFDHGVFSGARLLTNAFTIDFAAPKAGQTHEGSTYPDTDIVDGGDGDDIVRGNHGLDRLFGGSGADVITGESIEIRDSDLGDQPQQPVPTSETSFGNTIPVLDPQVGTFVNRVFKDDFEFASIDGARWSSIVSTVSDPGGLQEPSGIKSARFSNTATLASTSMDLARAAEAFITYSYQQTGSGESPDANNDLILEIEDLEANSWIEVDRQLGSGPDMTNFVQRRIVLPDTALRSNFRFRFRTFGDGPNFDEWFVDDVVVDASFRSPQLLAAVAEALGDPVTAGPISSKNSIVLDGIDDHLTVPFAAALNPVNFTVEFYAKYTAFSGRTSAIASTIGIDVDRQGFQIGTDFDNNNQAIWRFETGRFNGFDKLLGPLVDTTRLTHVAASFEATSGPNVNGVYTGNMTLYVDGILAASREGQYKPQNLGKELVIGATEFFNSTKQLQFPGVIDELRLWNDVRTQEEISQNLLSTISASTPNLVAYYRFDEGVGTTASDIAPPPNTATLVNGASWSTLSFDQTPILEQPLTASRFASLKEVDASNRRISDLNGAEFLTNVRSLNLAGNNLDDSDISALLPRRLTTGAQAGELVGLQYLEQLDLSNNSSITSVGQLVSFPELKSLKLEGTNVDLSSTSSLNTLTTFTKLTNLNVPSQILNPGQNVITVEGQTTSLPFQVGVLNFDGVDDYVEIPNVTPLGFNGNFTASAWIFPTEISGGEWVFGNGNAGALNQTLHLGLRDGRMHMGFFGNDLEGTTQLALNQWHHVTWQFNAGVQTMYLNGDLEATSLGGVVPFAGTDPVLIGRAFSPAGFGSEFFNGAMDGVRVFNRALTPAEIEANMFDGVPRTGSDVSVDYRFNETSGSIAFDSSIQNRRGTLVGGGSFASLTNVPWTLSGVVTASGSSGPITFTAPDEGVAVATVLGNQFPVVVINANPRIHRTPNLGLANSNNGVREGQTIVVDAPRIVGNTVEYDVRIAGTIVDKYVVAEPGTSDRTNLLPQVTISDPTGQQTEIAYRGSLAINGTGFVDTGLRLGEGQRARATTFEAWVFPTASTGNRFVFDTAGSDGAGWALYHNGSTWRIDTGDTQFNTNRAITLNTWQHVAVVFDTAGVIRLYVNGVAVSLTTPIFIPEVVGTLNIGGDFAGQNSFVGNIDEFRVWDRALTAEEVAKLDDGPVAADSSNLIGWWKFNEGIGNVARDSSVRANDGRILALITPVSAVAQELNPSFTSANNTFNGSGLTVRTPIENSTHSNGFPNGGGSNFFWHTASSPATNDLSIEFDLGASFDLSEMLVWQFNAVFTGGDETNRGVKQYDLFVGSTPSPTTRIISDAQLAKATGTDAEPSQKISLAGLAKNVRFVRMKIDSNYGGPFVGLSEVRFVGTPNLWNSNTPPAYTSAYRFVDNGTYKITATFDDRDGGSDTLTSNVIVNNVPPAISSLNQGNLPVAIDKPITFNPTVADAGAKDTLSYFWEVTSSNGERILSADTLNFQFTPSRSGSYSVKLTVTDSDGGSRFLSQGIDVAPTAAIAMPASAQVGSIVQVDSAPSVALATPGDFLGTTLSADRLYSWSVKRGATTVASGTESNLSFVPLVAGTYVVELTLRDRFFNGATQTNELSTTVTRNLVVSAAAVVAVVAPAGSVGEGDTITLTFNNLPPVHEFGTRTVVPSVTGGSFTLLPSDDPEKIIVRFNNEGTFVVTASIQDTITSPNGAFASGVVVRTVQSASVTVNNLNPLVIADALSTTENSAVTMQARISDPGTLDTHTFTVDWGDGKTSTGKVASGIAAASHIYLQDGVYQATLKVNDTTTGTRTEIFQVTVANVAPVAGNDVASTHEHAVLSIPFTTLVANDTDVGTLDVLSLDSVSSLSNLGAAVSIVNSKIVYDPSNSSTLNALRQGQTGTDTLVYTIKDEAGAKSSATITLTVAGRNDLPTVPQVANSINEDVASVTGFLVRGATDVDAATVFTVTQVGGGTARPFVASFGSLLWNANGTYSYSLNNSLPAVQQLGLGQSLVETIPFAVDDGFSTTTSTLTITIQGTNDAPLAVPKSLTVSAGNKIDVGTGTIDDVVLASSPIAYWRLSDATGTVVANRNALELPMEPFWVR